MWPDGGGGGVGSVIMIIRAGHHPNVLSEGDYHNSVIFVSCNFLVVWLAGLVGYLLVRHRYRPTYNALRPVFSQAMRNNTLIGFVIAIIAHNGLLALAFLQYHQRIWWYKLNFL